MRIYLLKIFLGFFISFCITLSGYCLYRDDVNFNETKKEVEAQLKISKDNLEKDQQLNQLDPKESIEIEPISSNLSQKEIKTKPIKIIFASAALIAIVLGYFYYRRRQ
ncbi:MAG: hypothetical protein KBB01_00360 [Candidatus Omnitrophica bacterium]|jgi:hypothetical protein|nr:hypothetical protein [Candidatus Omnitrophota bacterium]